MRIKALDGKGHEVFFYNLNMVIIIYVPHLMAVTESNPKLSDSDNFLFRIRDMIIKVSLDNVDVGGHGLEIIIRLSRTQVSCAENMLNPSGG